MPDIEQNYALWNESYDWQQQGEEWSQTWGGSESQWFGCLFPRIHSFLPVESILEIGPGCGRWTHYLSSYCHRLTAVDLSEKCVEFCRNRFQALPHASFLVNDGKSLSVLGNGQWDFIFSFDSLVHAEADVIQCYLLEFAKRLTANGVAFIHHSNLAAYPELAAQAPHLDSHWRAPSVSAHSVKTWVERAGLVCVSQELVNWGRPELIDCLTVLTKARSRFERAFARAENPDFMKEANIMRERAPLYNFAGLANEPAVGMLSLDQKRVDLASDVTSNSRCEQASSPTSTDSSAVQCAPQINTTDGEEPTVPNDCYQTLCEKAAKQWNVSSRIHPDDFIFRFLLENPSFESKQKAVEYYFADGAKSARHLSTILRDICGLPGSALRLLEFASGYGCVTRHMKNALPFCATTACDIHPRAVQFIRETLHTPALLSGSRPEDLQLPHLFDVVFALSFFSHMPKTTFTRWLKTLANSVETDGYLIFTTHGLVSQRLYFWDYRFDSEGFAFHAVSEQKDLNLEEYGSTCVAPQYVFSQVFDIPYLALKYFQEGYWWSHQDLYVLRRVLPSQPTSVSHDSPLELPR